MHCTKEIIKKLNIECRNCYIYFYIEESNGKYKCPKCGYEEELEVLQP